MHQAPRCLTHPLNLAHPNLTTHFTATTCLPHLIKDLGIFLKTPPWLHPNFPKSTTRLIQVGHDNLSTHFPNQGIPNCYNTSWNMHHLSHPQVCWFSQQKQIALEPPSCLSSLQRNHYKSWKVQELNPTIPFQWNYSLQPCSKLDVLDLHFPKKLPLHMNSPQ